MSDISHATRFGLLISNLIFGKFLGAGQVPAAEGKLFITDGRDHFHTAGPQRGIRAGDSYIFNSSPLIGKNSFSKIYPIPS
jgi:hypothetical protein